MASTITPSKVDLTPRRHHGFAFLLFIMGTLFPPLAVAARFGVGKDFWLNLLLTICGYIPGHVHNFYIQNIRNNKTHARTPKWAQRYGLVDTSTIERHAKRSRWAQRYNERLPQSSHESQPYEDGQEPASSVDLSLSDHHLNQSQSRQLNGELWREDDETYYNPPTNPSPTSSSRWRYPANFDDADPPKRKKEKKEKKDRWARTEDAYARADDQGRRKKSKKTKRKKDSSSIVTADSIPSTTSSFDVPEDAEGGHYGNGHGEHSIPQVHDVTADDVFQHQF